MHEGFRVLRGHPFAALSHCGKERFLFHIRDVFIAFAFAFALALRFSSRSESDIRGAVFPRGRSMGEPGSLAQWRLPEVLNHRT